MVWRRYGSSSTLSPADLWFAGWLFTLGFLHLSFWKGFLALVVWPYYVGVAVSSLLQR